MKGTNSINYIILIIIALVVVVGASQAATLTGSKADRSGTVSTVSSSGAASKDYLECTFKCIGHGECKDIRPSGQVCDEKGTCDVKPTCDKVFNPSKEAMKPDVYSEKESAEKQVTASFEGVFLPGGTLNIVLPPALKIDADGMNFWLVRILEGTKQIEVCSKLDGNTVVKNCDTLPCAVPCYFYMPEKKGDFDKKDNLPRVVLPYGMDSNGIETKLKSGVGYTIELLQHFDVKPLDKAKEEGEKCVSGGGCAWINGALYKIAGSRGDSWACPVPEVYTNTNYEPNENVVFNFLEAWVDNSKYNNVEKVEIGKRTEGSADTECDNPENIQPVVKPTCWVKPALHKKEDDANKGKYADYSFLMPYRMPSYGTQKEHLGISYPVFAKGTVKPASCKIEVTNSGVKSYKDISCPMCRSGVEAQPWHCPEKGCYVDTDGKIGDKGKSYIVSAIDRDNGKYPVKVCRYSKADEECSTGCRQLTKGGVKTAECNLPKPDIKSVFITTCKLDAKGKCTPDSICGTYTFKDGEYVENAKCLLTFDSYGRKFVTIAVQNDVPAGVADGALKITADKITDIKVFLGGKELKDIMPVKIRRYDSAQNIWKDESIDYSKGLSAVILKPQDYVEYEAMADADGSDSIQTNPHGVGVSITIDPNTKIASDTKLAMPFTYYIFQKCCSDCGSCKALGAEVCAGTDMNKGQCGNWCAWDSILGVYSYCKSK